MGQNDKKEEINGYELMAQSYEKILQDPDIDVRIIEKKIKALHTIAVLDDDDINELFNTSAFNDIAKGYLIIAMENADLTEEQMKDIQRGLKFAFEEVTAAQARKRYEES